MSTSIEPIAEKFMRPSCLWIEREARIALTMNFTLMKNMVAKRDRSIVVLVLW